MRPHLLGPSDAPNLDITSLESLILLSARYKVILWKIPNNLGMKIKRMLAFRMLAPVMLAVLCVLSGFKDARAQRPNSVGIVVPSRAKKMLSQAAQRLESSSPLRCQSNMQVNLFGTQLVANGKYMQMGQGTGIARLEFAYGDEVQQQILQICHRGYYYRFRVSGAEPRLEVVDLRRIIDSDSKDLVANPTTWMATGGLASLLRNLSRYFEFDIPEKAMVGDTPVWKLKGKWNEIRLKRLLFGQVSYPVIKDKIDWSHLPDHVPQTCELLLARDEYFPLFPYSIRFDRNFDENGNSISKAIVRLELHELETNVKLEEHMFLPDFQNVQPVSLTDQFVERIESLKKIQRSANHNKGNKATR